MKKKVSAGVPDTSTCGSGCFSSTGSTVGSAAGSAAGSSAGASTGTSTGSATTSAGASTCSATASTGSAITSTGVGMGSAVCSTTASAVGSTTGSSSGFAASGAGSAFFFGVAFFAAGFFAEDFFSVNFGFDAVFVSLDDAFSSAFSSFTSSEGAGVSFADAFAASVLVDLRRVAGFFFGASASGASFTGASARGESDTEGAVDSAFGVGSFTDSGADTLLASSASFFSFFGASAEAFFALLRAGFFSADFFSFTEESAFAPLFFFALAAVDSAETVASSDTGITSFLVSMAVQLSF